MWMGAVDVGMQLIDTAQQGGIVPRWWNPLGSPAIDSSTVWAYRAQASLGSPWPLAPSNYAESLQNWVNPGVNDLVEGNGPVPWGAAVGWTFTAASSQYFLTGVIPTNDQAFVIFIQFSSLLGFGRLSLARTAAQREFGVTGFAIGAPVRAGYWNGDLQYVAPGLGAGNLAVVGNQGYRNGVVDGGPINIWAGTSLVQIPIGCRYFGAADNFVTAEIQAVMICDNQAAFTAADIAAMAALPGGSMQNL